ncbi:Acyl-coenzyme A:6-aminopenicillanic acid acyl-transferase [Andreprevotia lacus DSM 23236]|jgi:hypothetical protein|uniref:Acyl-coenzyme A:6-aminopenicillanic acid acyl-transferase n=1 Tax=Andreprevotia lacus DSM 23236 TaxID=1121001 RepID=A0A1W1XUI6_9NEIS|nr:C45 family peptidase [Andreprevotia lacus]SMC27532.1 Acyl-coenzyme A:6-aminopenicillanic acid acyl-transferase [Andreprevotia lacus DSM 23236]
MDPHNLAEEQAADYQRYAIAGTPDEMAATLAAIAAPLAPPLQFQQAGWSTPQRDYARACRALTAELYPQLVEEIDAYADAAHVARDDMLWHYSLGVTGGCSAVAVRTRDGMVVGRNYDFFYFENRRHLLTTRPAGRYAHVGMHDGLAGGRFDGMNEHGLFVSFNGAGEHADPAPVGLTFHHVVRYLLERCRSMAEARAALLELPIKEAKSYLLVDAGDACVVEAHTSRRAVRELDDSGLLRVTNHYLHPAMQPLCPPWPNSEARFDALGALQPAQGAEETVAQLRALLAGHDAPLCGHQDGLATFWSAVAQPATGEISYCLGAPCRNPWLAAGPLR